MSAQRILAASLFGIAALVAAGCGQDNSHDNSGGTTGSTSGGTTGGMSSADFSDYVQALITQQTCDTDTPADINDVTFTFASDQDTADPTDVSGITPGCTS